MEGFFSARNRASASSIFTTLDGEAAKGYVETPTVKHTIAMQLARRALLPCRVIQASCPELCKFSSTLTAKAYRVAGQTTSALHTMTLLQVYQANAMKQLHEGSSGPGVMQEQHSVITLSLQATKVTARSLGQTMFTLVFQES